MRQALALAVLLGGFAFIYLWLGLVGLAGAGAALTIVLVTIGVASGYWVGFDPEADVMVTELMRWLRKRRSVGRGDVS